MATIAPGVLEDVAESRRVPFVFGITAGESDTIVTATPAGSNADKAPLIGSEVNWTFARRVEPLVAVGVVELVDDTVPESVKVVVPVSVAETSGTTVTEAIELLIPFTVA